MKNTTLNLKSLSSTTRHIGHTVQRYTVIIFIVSILALYGFLVFQIGALSQVEPDETAVTEQLNKVKRLKIDQKSVDKIQQLEDQNIGVQSLYKTARDNPFQAN